MKKILTAVALATLTISTATSVMANTKTTKTFSKWRVDCVKTDKAKACVIAQVLINQKTKQRVISMTVRKPKDEAAKVVLQVPLGVSLAPGLTLAIDNAKPLTIAYKACVPKGCVAEFALADEWIKALGGGTDSTVTVTSLKGEAAPFKFTLTGFADAYAYFTTEAP